MVTPRSHPPAAVLVSQILDDEMDAGLWADKVVSIDPGAVHCGVALWVEDFDGLWFCHWADELTPAECVDFASEADRRMALGRIVVEGFWLKPGLDAMRQAGSEMETCEVIGAIRHMCRRRGTKFEKVANGQAAIITRLDAAGYRWTSRGSGGHAKDAEAIGVRGLGLKVRQLRVVDEHRKRSHE